MPSERVRRTLVSVDLDDLACYRTIYGLPAADDPEVVLEHCLPRFLDLFGELGIRATFFVIGRVVDRARGGLGEAQLRRALAEGHELGNHSYAHAYDLSRWPADRIQGDLRRNHAVLEELGARPCGFRAPGYCHDAGVLSEVAKLGYRYDSSSLPSWSYYAAKTAMMRLLRARGRRSGALDAGMAAFLGPKAPFVHAPTGLWELPVSVSPWGGVPLIGTSLLLLPEPLAGALRWIALRRAYLHIELHGLDLVDPARDPCPPELRPIPELRVSLELKLARLRRLLAARDGYLRLCDWPSAAAEA